jgi:hypothetical protein
MATTINNLPRLLSITDQNNREASQRALTDELNNDSICLRLGRAFLQGRLARFMGKKEALDHNQPPPCPTQDECNLYAGGYQYIDDVLATMEAMVKGPDGIFSTEGLTPQQAQEMAQVKAMHDRLTEIDRLVATQGITLELLNERCDIRFAIHNQSIGNLMRMVTLGQSTDHLADVIKDAFERRPIATGRPDNDDGNA